MQCLIQVFKVNSDYSQEYADERYDGNESEFNRKHEWMDELVVPNGVLSVEEFPNGTYNLQGEREKGTVFNIEVPNMHLYQVHSIDAPPFYVGASKQILLETNLTLENDDYVIQMFLTDREPFSNPVPGIYISAADFPKELLS